MSDYTASNQEDRFAVYASCGETLERNRGIKRLGVIRADVDDLGATFAGGLPNQRTNVCRTSTLSRSLSIFFKSTIDEIMERGRYQAQIIYSGGDDLFVVGNWSDVIYAAIDIRNAFVAYTGNEAVTLSAGVGIFGETYPIARMAAQTGELEDAAKGHTTGTGTSSKNAIALWSPEYVFGWTEFCNDVLPRMQKIRNMFEGVQKGNAFIYKIIVLLRSYNSIASAPRLAYLLARSFEEDTEHGSESCRQLYAWAQDVQERRRLLVSLEWYVLSKREGNKQ
jgi:CRISPR-associated protein Csm1